MMGSCGHMSLDGGYEVDGGKSGENLADTISVAMESSTVFNSAK